MKAILGLIMFLALEGFAFAEDEPSTIDRHPDSFEEISARAQGRQYPGGADESSLEVQRQIYSPSRTIVPGKALPEDLQTTESPSE